MGWRDDLWFRGQKIEEQDHIQMVLIHIREAAQHILHALIKLSHRQGVLRQGTQRDEMPNSLESNVEIGARVDQQRQQREPQADARMPDLELLILLIHLVTQPDVAPNQVISQIEEFHLFAKVISGEQGQEVKLLTLTRRIPIVHPIASFAEARIGQKRRDRNNDRDQSQPPAQLEEQNKQRESRYQASAQAGELVNDLDRFASDILARPLQAIIKLSILKGGEIQRTGLAQDQVRNMVGKAMVQQNPTGKVEASADDANQIHS